MQPPLVYDDIPNMVLKEISDVIVIYFFGSRADGTYHPDSDLH